MGSLFDGQSVKNRNKIYEIPAGTVILQEGEVNLDMYKIISGHVEMYTGYGTENEVLIGILGPETCFGEFGILTGQPAIYTIITFSETQILRVTEGIMGEFIQENREDILKIMKNMAVNMMRMQHQINQLNEELVLRKIEQQSELRDECSVDTAETQNTIENIDKEYIDELRKNQRDELRHYALYNYPASENDKAKMRFLTDYR